MPDPPPATHPMNAFRARSISKREGINILRDSWPSLRSYSTAHNPAYFRTPSAVSSVSPGNSLSFAGHTFLRSIDPALPGAGPSRSQISHYREGTGAWRRPRSSFMPLRSPPVGTALKSSALELIFSIGDPMPRFSRWSRVSPPHHPHPRPQPNN